MTQRDMLFDIICDIKYAAIYGFQYADRMSRVNMVVNAALAFVFSGAFCSFWLWEGHARTLAAVMLAASLLQMLSVQFGLDKMVTRIRTASQLLSDLYDDALFLWNDAEAKGRDGDYRRAAEHLGRMRGRFIAIANKDVGSDDRCARVATELMNSHVKSDFNL